MIYVAHTPHWVGGWSAETHASLKNRAPGGGKISLGTERALFPSYHWFLLPYHWSPKTHGTSLILSDFFADFP